MSAIDAQLELISIVGKFERKLIDLMGLLAVHAITETQITDEGHSPAPSVCSCKIAQDYRRAQQEVDDARERIFSFLR